MTILLTCQELALLERRSSVLFGTTGSKYLEINGAGVTLFGEQRCRGVGQPDPPRV
jgi:hypothetical protein